MKSHPACVSSSRIKGKFDFSIADRFLSDYGSDVTRKEKSRSSSLKISPVRMKTCRVMKTASKSKHKWGQTCACLVATRWPCVTLGLIAFHGGAHATLSSWGAEAPAVTHHQQRNIIVKRSTQKKKKKSRGRTSGTVRLWVSHEYSNWLRYLCDDY